MRNSIGGAWLFSISITLMMFIIAYVAITIDYSNAYQLKNDIILIIEQYNGLNTNSAPKIIKRIKAKKYLNRVDCSKDYDTSTYYEGAHDGYPSQIYYTVTTFDGGGHFEPVVAASERKNGYVCIYKYKAVKKDSLAPSDSMTKAFYAVTTSFGFDFPIIGKVFDYRVTGETGVINYPDDSGYNFQDRI